MPKVLVTARSFAKSPEAKAVLTQAGYEIQFNPFDRPLVENELIELIKGMDALVAGMDEVTDKVMEAGLPTLKIIAKHGVGYNTIDVAAANRRGIPVTITPGANNKSVAELAMGLMLSVARHTATMDKIVRNGGWNRITGNELGGKTLGVVGMGSIGSEVAKRAAAFDMKIVAYDVYPRQDLVDQYGVSYLPLQEVITQADFLSLHAPSLPETVGMINRETLQQMKKNAILINTARGDLVVEEDLIAALTDGTIAGAGLDTFANEPVQDKRLFNLDNVVMTPHAGANTHEAVTRMGVMAAEEVVRVLSGQAPINTVKVK